MTTSFSALTFSLYVKILFLFVADIFDSRFILGLVRKQSDFRSVTKMNLLDEKKGLTLKLTSCWAAEPCGGL